MNLTKNLHWLICLIFVGSCARQSAPTGGPKDTIPPTVISSIPGRESVNFDGKVIELEFSELVDVNNPNEQLIISPTIGKDFEIKPRKNKIILTLKKDLQDSTTYTLNFRDAVRDITEKNPARNLQFVLSTGSYIDSLSIAGTTSDILTSKELPEITVAVHEPNDTFNIFTHPATYFTKTSKTGTFKIANLKPGTYYIYAFNDKNKNLIIDSKSESYGFETVSIDLTEDLTNINLGLVKLDSRELKITGARPFNTYFNLRLSKSLTTVDVKPTDNTDIYFTYGDDQSNIKIYNTIGERDSLGVNVIGTDSIGNTIDSLVYLSFLDKAATPEKFTAALSNTTIMAENGKLTATVTFTKPLREINPDSLFLRIDSTTTIPLTQENIDYKEATRILTISKLLGKQLFYIDPEKEQPKEGRKNNPELYAGQGAFISIENDSSSATKQQITPIQPNTLSSIMFEVATDSKTFVVQLLDKNNSLVKEVYNIKKGDFTNLTSGEYRIRVYSDRNNNRQWDAGNYFKKQEPEPMVYSKNDKGETTIALKESWDYETQKMLITP